MTRNLNLLRQLKSSDYKSLIDQVKLARSGYKFHFIVDADLIGNYCYPLGIIPHETRRERAKKLNEDYLSDEQITLHSLFYIPDNHKRLLLLDQYFYEVEAMLYKASMVGNKKMSELDINFGIFKFENKGELVNLMYEHFAQIFTKALLHINGVKKAKNLFDQKKLILDNNELEDESCKNIVSDCDSIFTNLDEVKRVMQTSLGSIKNKKKQLFASKNRDAIILNRVLCFNASAKSRNVKHVYIMLSDSPIMKYTIKAIQFGESLIDYPKVQRKSISFYRNVAQSFAYAICLEYKNDGAVDYDKTIKNLTNLGDASDEINAKLSYLRKRDSADGIYNQKEFDDDITNLPIFSNYRRLRNAFENTGLLRSFTPLYDSIRAELDGRDVKDVQRIFSEFRKLGEGLSKDLVKNHVTFLRKLRRAGEFNAAFVYGINRIKIWGETFDITKGADYVEGSYHHLPIFLTFQESNSEYKTGFNSLIELILKKDLISSNRIIGRMENLIKIMNLSKLHEFDKVEANILKAFLFMILPSSLDDGVKNNDLISNSWLSNLAINKSDITDLANKAYLQIWVTRRIRKYDEAITLAKKSIKNYPQDPRFYHGLFLAQYCKSEEQGNCDSKLLEALIGNLDTSLELYYQFVVDNFHNESIFPLIMDAIEESYINSYCYCSSLLAQNLLRDNDMEQFVSKMDDIREAFDELKDREGRFHHELPEYFDTEALIEYLESFYVDDKISKLKYASEAIKKAREKSTDLSLIKKYNSKLDKIEKRIDELKG